MNRNKWQERRRDVEKEVDKERSNRSRNSKRSKRGKNNSNHRDNDVTTPVESTNRIETKHENMGIWYYTDREIMDQASRLSFQSILGTPSAIIGKRPVPTTALFYMNPSPGTVEEYQDSTTTPVSEHWLSQKAGINMVAFKLFTKLSIASGRTSTYTPSDVAFMILAMGELISMIEWLRRFFGIAFTYNQRNRVWPKDIVEMLGVDSTDFFANLANYRMRLNTLITRVKQLPIPENIAYFHKCEMLYQNAYLDDASSPMAQVYMFQPAQTWVLTEPGDAAYEGSFYNGNDPYLRTVDVATKPHYTGSQVDGADKNYQLFSVYLDILEEMIDALLRSSTLNIVYADILNYVAKAGTKMWSFDYVSEAYAIEPYYNQTMLEIIHNLGCAGTIPTDYNVGSNVWDETVNDATYRNDVAQAANAVDVLYNPYFSPLDLWNITGASPSSAWEELNLIDLANYNADVDTRLDVMQYKVPILTVGGGIPSHLQRFQLDLPDHYCVCAGIFSDSGSYAMLAGYMFNRYTIATPGYTYNSYQMCQFDWAPLSVSGSADAGSSPATFSPHALGIGTDLNYFTLVDSHYMHRLFNLAFLGLFDFR